MAYRLPVLSVLSLLLGGAVLGIGKLALRLHVERSRPRVEVYTGRSKAKSPGTQMRIAESSAELVAAELLLQRSADLLDALAATGAYATLEQRAELKWHATYVVELCRRATDRLFSASGAHAVYDDSRMQTVMRDMNTACHHASVDFDSTAEMFGRVALGLEPGTPLV
jgi:alkylation response protein AidB-like acyl-CoA dehydrogenase